MEEGARAGDIKGFNITHVTKELFANILHGHKPSATLINFRPLKLNTANSILGTLTAADEEIKRFVGNTAYRVQYKMPGDAEDEYHSKDIVLKAKPPSEETVTMLNNLAKYIGGTLADVFEKYKYDTDFTNTDHREIEMLRIKDPAVTSIQPRIFHTLLDDEMEIFVYVNEHFVKEGYTHMDSVEDISIWKEGDILDVLRGIAGMHARYYGLTEEIPAKICKWLKPQDLLHIKPLLEELFQHNSKSFKDVWNTNASDMTQLILKNLSDINDILQLSPKTLVHNDCNVRNMCLRPSPREGKKRLCLYDWELASIATPQHDVAEFLCYVLPNDASATIWQGYVKQYLAFLKEEVKQFRGGIPNELAAALEPNQFMRVFDASVMELLVNRFPLYGLAHTQSPYPFLGRVIQNTAKYVQGVKNDYSFLQQEV